MNMNTTLILTVAAILLIAACTSAADAPARTSDSASETQAANAAAESDQNDQAAPAKTDEKESEETDPVAPVKADGPDTGDLPSWMTSDFQDVNSGDTFTLADFEGKQVLVESFAVWCPKCLQQQKISKELHEELSDKVVSVNINTDANEDEEKVKQHTLANGFNWRFAVATGDVTQDLIDEFGLSFVSAPQVPMVLICEDQRFRRLGSGIKQLDELRSELSAGCA